MSHKNPLNGILEKHKQDHKMNGAILKTVMSVCSNQSINFLADGI